MNVAFFSGFILQGALIIGGLLGWGLYIYQRHINNALKTEIEGMKQEFRIELAREKENNAANREALKAIIESMARSESSKAIAAEVKKKVDAIFERAENGTSDND